MEHKKKYSHNPKENRKGGKDSNNNSHNNKNRESKHLQIRNGRLKSNRINTYIKLQWSEH